MTEVAEEPPYLYAVGGWRSSERSVWYPSLEDSTSDGRLETSVAVVVVLADFVVVGVVSVAPVFAV